MVTKTYSAGGFGMKGHPTYRFGVLKHCILCGRKMWFTSRDWHQLCSLGKMMARSLDNMLDMHERIERRNERE